MVVHLQRCRTRKRQGVLSYQPARSWARKNPIIKFLRVTACCERSLECLGASINHIYQKLILAQFRPGEHQGRSKRDTSQKEHLFQAVLEF